MATTQYIVMLDRQVQFAAGTGTFGGVNTTWTLPFTDATFNTIVPAQTAGAGTDGVPVTASSSGTTLTAAGNFSACAITAGRSYPCSFELSPMFVRGRDGRPSMPLVASIQRLIIAHRRSGPYTITCIRPTAMGTKTQTFAPTAIVDNFGRYQAWVGGSSIDNRFTISNTGAKPMIIAGIDIVYEPAEGAF